MFILFYIINILYSYSDNFKTQTNTDLIFKNNCKCESLSVEPQKVIIKITCGNYNIIYDNLYLLGKSQDGITVEGNYLFKNIFFKKVKTKKMEILYFISQPEKFLYH